MIGNQILQGDHKQWRLLELLAEGDAGEVFLVESVFERTVAVLKRPHSRGFSADITRQSSQIASEASILKVLSGLRLTFGEYCIKINDLLDQSLPGSELTERFFIVLQKAPGVSLTALSRIARFGAEGTLLPDSTTESEQKTWIKEIAASGKIPDLLLLRTINALLELLPTIHSLKGSWFGDEIHGVLWNDIKTDHIFWDPVQTCLTVIDWGNGQFFEQDGVSRDRRFSAADDYHQLVEELGRFLAEVNPALHQQLEWPSSISTEQLGPEGLNELHGTSMHLLREETGRLLEVRQRENYLLSSGSARINKLNELVEAQRKLHSFAEMPDIEAAARLVDRTAATLASTGKLDEFQQVCQLAIRISTREEGKWKLLREIADLAASTEAPIRGHYLDALRAGVNDEWAGANWSLFLAANHGKDVEAWSNYSNQIRKIVPEIVADTPSPYLTLTRLLQVLEDELSRLQSRSRVAAHTSERGASHITLEKVPLLESLVAKLKFEITQQWKDIDPLPPGSDLSYSTIESMLAELQEILPQLGIDPATRLGAVRRALSQPAAQSNILLDAWVAKGFKTARQGLRQLLLWDPDRRRVHRADALIESAQAWLDEVRNGPQPGEKLKEYAIRMEYTAREMRSRIGKAPWIDSSLWLFSELRSGGKPGDLLADNQELSADFPWLKRFERKATPEKSPQSPLTSKGPQISHGAAPSKSGKLGAGQDMHLLEPLDIWVPEARGSSARVFTGLLSQKSGQPVQAAVKVMRPDKASYALPLFQEEVQVLSILKDIPGIVHALECGFIKVEGFQELSSESALWNAGALMGDTIRYHMDNANLYLAELSERAQDGWLPYIAMEKVNQAECLLLACDEGYTKGQYLQVESAVQITLQICEILQIAHEREIVYRDHKILHYYWSPIARRVSVIDWNVAKWYSEGLTEAEMHFDLVQLGARGLHHLFTGRPAPGALPVGPTRPEEVEMAPQSYAAAWTYDDKQRLPLEIRDILANLLSGGYGSAAQLREDYLLQSTFSKG
jgi:serine/threonine protein kinase